MNELARKYMLMMKIRSHCNRLDVVMSKIASAMPTIGGVTTEAKMKLVYKSAEPNLRKWTKRMEMLLEELNKIQEGTDKHEA